MKIYWFMDNGDDTIQGIAARNEDAAWKHLAKDNLMSDGQEISEDLVVEAKGSYRIVALTKVTDTEGQVATFYLREGDIYIRPSFGGEGLGHLEDI